MSQQKLVQQTKRLNEENKMLKDKLERANQQIKLLAAVLQIVHEDLSLKNDQLEVLYSHLRHNPVWQDCMLTVNQPNLPQNLIDNSTILTNDNDKDDASNRVPRVLNPRSVRSRSHSPRSRIKYVQNSSLNDLNNIQTTTFSTQSIQNIDNQSNRHKFVISSDIIRTINPFTKCYLSDMSEHTQIQLCSFIPYKDLSQLAQCNKLWYNIISHDLVWRICFRVKWPKDEFTYSSESSDSCDEYGKPKKDNINPYNPDIAFANFHKSLHKRNKHKKNKKKKQKQLISHNSNSNSNSNRKYNTYLTVNDLNNDGQDLAPDPDLDLTISPSPSPIVSSINNSMDKLKSAYEKPWKQQFMDRIHIERNWRQGTAKVMTLMGHNGSVTDLKFDEYRLITSSDDGSIILWHLNNMKKWKPKNIKYMNKHRKQLEKGNYNNKNMRYKFFASKQDNNTNNINDNDDNNDDINENKYDNDNDKFPRAPRSKSMDINNCDKDKDDHDDDSDSMSSSVSTSTSIQQQYNNPNKNAIKTVKPVPTAVTPSDNLNNKLFLYQMNDDWNLNDTKLSAWRHSFVNTFSSKFRSKLKMLRPYTSAVVVSKSKKKKSKIDHPTLDQTNLLLQNHHYSKDLNFKRLSFNGHGGPIWALDFDNEILVSGSYDKCIKIWNIINGNCRCTLRGHTEWVSGVKLYKKYILSCSWDATIRLWKLDNNRFNGNCISKLQTSSGNAIYCIEWSRDRNYIIAGCRHQALQVWDLKKEKMIKTFMGHTKQVYCLYMSNNLILSGSADRTIKMWDPRTAACLGTFTDHMGPVMKLQFDDHKLISAGYDKQVRIFDLRARKQLHSLSGHSKVIFSLQYDNQKIITGSADKAVLVWNFN